MRIVGYYINCDDALCTACFDEYYPGDDWEIQVARWLKAGGFEDWTEPLTILESSETDSPTHCDDCGIVIEEILTRAGGFYVVESMRECIDEGKMNPVVAQWFEVWENDCDVQEAIAAESEDLKCTPDEFEARFKNLPLDTTWLEREDLQRYVDQMPTWVRR